MPIYEYECRKCGHRLEVMQRVSDPPRKRCPECGGALKKLISAPAIQFKGSGWYVTDYGGKRSGAPTGGGAADAKGDGQSKGETRTETKGDAKGDTKGDKGKAGGEGSGGGSKGSAPSASGGG
jgi:putative FmdB family regulatory protein